MTEPQAPPLPPLTPEQADLRELVQRLARVQAKITDPVKATAGDSNFDKRLKGGGVKEYKFADLVTVLQVVRPALAAEQLALTQVFDNTQSELRLVTRVLYGVAFIESVWLQPMPPMPSSKAGDALPMGQAQKIGACATYARRKALLAIVGVQDDEQDDPDLGGEREPAAEPRKEAIREKAQERAAESKAAAETGPQPMTGEELRAQALRLQKWAAQRGVQLPDRGVLKVLFDAKKWDIMSRKDVQEWGRILDDPSFEPSILSFLRSNFGPATEPEAVSYSPSNPAAVMKAITTWAKAQELANPDSEDNTKVALSTLLADLKMEYSEMTPEKWGKALLALLDPKQTAHWLGVLGDCYPPF